MRVFAPAGVFTPRAKRAIANSIPVGSPIRDALEYAFLGDYEFLKLAEAAGRTYDEVSMLAYMIMLAYKMDIRRADSRVESEYSARANEIFTRLT